MNKKLQERNIIEEISKNDYKFGSDFKIPTETLSAGLNEEVIEYISKKRNEPAFMTKLRKDAFAHFQTMTEPTWPHLHYPQIDYQNIKYFSAPTQAKKLKSLDELDPEIKNAFDVLGIPLSEQNKLANVAIDAVMDSVSVATTFQKKLKKHGVIFCSMSEAIAKYPNVIEKYLCSVVPYTDNYFAALNTAVFGDGSFCYIPKGVVCPMDLSTYFRINAEGTGQFERTLIIADEGSTVNYLEGCTAPKRDENQLHAAVVELYAHASATINYSTVQNWYPGDKDGKGGIYNFVTKRGLAEDSAKIAWTQVETGSSITWKYPSCILKGDNSIGEFYSVALTNNYQQADTGTKMIHKGKNTKSRIISKGISLGNSSNTYRGLVRMLSSCENGENYSQCDSLIIGNASAHTYPYLESSSPTSKIHHEATTSKVDEMQLAYFRSRGIGESEALSMIVSGYCREVLDTLPLEFAAESEKLLSLSLEGGTG